jgi:DUF1680 family protein
MNMIHTVRESSAPVAPSTGLRPLGLDEVTITGGFWGERQRVNAEATLGHIRHWLEKEGWLGNFDLAASGTLPEGRRGREFSDSEVYKYLEAVAWELGRSDDAALRADFDAVVARVAAAQEPDGYLNTRFGRAGQPPRWSQLEWGHELYCLGHLFQAAVARLRTGHDENDLLVRVALRAAGLVCATFGADGKQAICGHAEVEVGLAELGRATGRPQYVEQARLFVERHGLGTLADIEWGRSYFQDDVPVRDATVLRGHAVRANYLSAAAVDVAVETGDTGLLHSLQTQWDNTIARRTYVTGGQGSHHTGESFGEDWVLPPDRAYSETCAAVGSIMFSWRLLLASGESKYADLIERSLFNVVATSPSAEGTSFFYANTLHRRTPDAPVAMDEISPRAASSLRAPWFEVSCCPPNVARTFASLAAYIATADDAGVQVHQYAPSRIRTALGDGREVELEVQTDYPTSGTITIVVVATPDDSWALSLRVPEWAATAELAVAGERSSVAPGTVTIERVFRAGDELRLELPMTPRFVTPSSRIDAIRGTVAVERGPEVLALESVDVPGGGEFADLTVDASTPPAEHDGRVWVTLTPVAAREADWPYRPELIPDDTADGPTVTAPLVAYHDWARRGPSSMRVWIPTAT